MSVARTVTLMESDVEQIRLLTLDEAAEVLQVSKRTVRRMVDQKEFPAFKVGGQWRVRESEVAKWIQGLSDL
jgi:excisionase family DNA binding protein